MNAIVASSGTTGFAPSLGEMILEAFSRVQIRPASLTADHFSQARMSANLLQSEWSNVGMPLLWRIQPIQIALQPGVSAYAAPSNVIAPLDATITLYQPGPGQNFTAAITGAAGQNLATINQPLHGLGAGALAYFNTAIAASGQVIQGAYLVNTVIDQNNYEIQLPTPMDGTNSVALPIFTTTAGSQNIQITLPNHNLSIGGSFYCNVPVTVAGLTISGQLVVNGVIDQDNFTVNLGQAASATASATMNGGLAQVATQAPGVDTTDFILSPVSRTDYVSQPDKGPNLQFRPTTFWFQRLRNPIIQFWNAPDDAGPYIFTLWAFVASEDAVVQGGVGIDVPYRFLEAFASGLAAKLSRKWPPSPSSGVTTADLKKDADEALQAALLEDIERTGFFITPGLSSYYR